MDKMPAPITPGRSRDLRYRSSGSAGLWSRGDTVLVLVLYFGVVGSARSVVSVDSHLYLSSAKALFTGDVGTWFHWIREPLLPAMLKLTNILFGTSDLGYLMTVSAVVMAALATFGQVAWPRRAGLRRGFLIVTALNPLLHGFVGHVGQQALVLSIVIFGAAWALSESRRAAGVYRKRRNDVVAAAILGASCGFASFVLIPLAIAISITPLMIRWTASGSYSTARGRLRAAGPFIPSMVVVVAAVVALGGWWGYKTIVLIGSEPALRFSGAWAWDYDVSDGAFEQAGVDLADKFRGLAAFGPEQHLQDGKIVSLPTAFELRLYGGLSRDWSVDACGVLDPGPQHVEDFVGEYFGLSCRPSWGGTARAVFGGIAVNVYRVALLALALSAVLSIWRRRYLTLVLPAAGLLAPYMVGGLGISRYAFPLWPLGVAAVIFMLEDSSDWIRWRQREKNPDAGISLAEP